MEEQSYADMCEDAKFYIRHINLLEREKQVIEKDLLEYQQKLTNLNRKLNSFSVEEMLVLQIDSIYN